MRCLYLCLAMIAGCAPALQSGTKTDDEQAACRVSLLVFEKHIWELRVGPERVSGDVNRLEEKEGVISGYLAGKPCRLRENNGRIDGRLAGMSAMLNVEESAEHIKITGTLGGDRLTAEVSADVKEDRLTVEASLDKIILANNKMVVSLERLKEAGPGGPIRLVSDSGHVALEFDGCQPSVAVGRPGLAIMLQQMVLARVADFEDVSK